MELRVEMSSQTCNGRIIQVQVCSDAQLGDSSVEFPKRANGQMVNISPLDKVTIPSHNGARLALPAKFAWSAPRFTASASRTRWLPSCASASSMASFVPALHCRNFLSPLPSASPAIPCGRPFASSPSKVLLHRNLHRGVVVSQLSLRDVQEIYHLRRMLEIPAVLAARKPNPELTQPVAVGRRKLRVQCRRKGLGARRRLRFPVSQSPDSVS